MTSVKMTANPVGLRGAKLNETVRTISIRSPLYLLYCCSKHELIKQLGLLPRSYGDGEEAGELPNARSMIGPSPSG